MPADITGFELTDVRRGEPFVLRAPDVSPENRVSRAINPRRLRNTALLVGSTALFVVFPLAAIPKIIAHVNLSDVLNSVGLLGGAKRIVEGDHRKQKLWTGHAMAASFLDYAMQIFNGNNAVLTLLGGANTGIKTFRQYGVTLATRGKPSVLKSTVQSAISVSSFLGVTATNLIALRYVDWTNPAAATKQLTMQGVSYVADSLGALGPE